MKPLDAEDIYRYANFQFPDNGDLALFNLVVETMTGKLAYEVIDGPPEVVSDARTDIAAAIGFGSVGQSLCKIKRVFDQDHASQRDVLEALVRGIKVDLTEGHGAFRLPRPPFTIAALIACEGHDGRFAYALFRHPSLDHRQALMVIVSCLPTEKNGDPTPTSSN